MAFKHLVAIIATGVDLSTLGCCCYLPRVASTSRGCLPAIIALFVGTLPLQCYLTDIGVLIARHWLFSILQHAASDTYKDMGDRVTPEQLWSPACCRGALASIDYFPPTVVDCSMDLLGTFYLATSHCWGWFTLTTPI
jgi:hypothetical protein